MNICPQRATASKTILLIGSSAAPLTIRPDSPFCLVRKDTVPEGIAALRTERFDRVLVWYSAIAGRFETALSGLRQADPETRIILLAQMLEEPLLVEQTQNRFSRGLFDDYAICPVSVEQLVNGQAGAVASPVGASTDSDKDRRIAELERLVIQDDLTGLKNRRYLRQFLPQILDLAGRRNLRVTLLIFDIDDFKHYNDAYGHTVGDNVLRQAGRMIEHCCRGHDVVARFGGDEFAVVFWDLPAEKPTDLPEHLSRRDRRSAGLEHPREPLLVAERFCRQLRQAAFEYIGPKGKGALTISGGLATYPADGKTVEELFEKADMAMLEAKRSGKNRVYLVGQPNGQSE